MSISHKATLFVAIGGSGIKSLALLKLKIIEEYNNPENIKIESDLPNKWKEHRFLFIDTTEKDINEYNEKAKQKMDYFGITGNLISDNEKIITGNIDPKKYAEDNSTNERFSSWYPRPNDMIVGGESSEKYNYSPKTSAITGAGADRVNGRVVYHKAAPTIERVIEQKLMDMTQYPSIKKMLDGTNDDGANLWIISGTNGGTGSSFTLDLCYVLRKIGDKIFEGCALPKVCLALLAPQPYVDAPGNERIWQYKHNSFAFFKEMAFFTSTGQNGTPIDQNYKLFYVNDTFAHIDDKPFLPYDIAVMFDTQIKGEVKRLVLPNTWENVAQSLFLINCQSVGDEVRNYLIANSVNTKLVKVQRASSVLFGQEWKNDISATGTTTLKVPLDKLRQYLSSRLKYDLINGLIGDRISAKSSDIYDFVQFLVPFISEKISANQNFIKYFKVDFSADNKAKDYSGELSTWKEELSKKTKNLDINFKSKEHDLSYLNFQKEITSMLVEKFNELILNFGLEYVKDFIFKLDEYLAKSIDELDSKCQWRILKENKLTFDAKKESDNSKISKFDSLIKEEESILNNEKKKWLIYFQHDLVTSLYLKKSLEKESVNNGGILDHFLSFKQSCGIEIFKGFLSTINEEKFYLDFKNFKHELETCESEKPFELYLPPLANQTKPNSEFNQQYSMLVNFDINSDKIRRDGANGLRNLLKGLFSLFDNVEYFNKHPHLRGQVEDIQSPDQNYLFKFAIDEDINKWVKIEAAFQIMSNILVDRHFENPSNKFVKDDLNTRLTTLSKMDTKYFDSLKGAFQDKDFITLPHNAAQSEKIKVYSWSHKKNLGFYNLLEIGSQNTFAEIENSFEFSKITFERGISFPDYNYADGYAKVHKDNLDGIEKESHKKLRYNPLCYMNKHFIWDDLETVKKSLGIGKGVNNVFQLAFYSSIFDLLKEIKPDFYLSIIDSVATNSSANSRVKRENTETIKRSSIFGADNTDAWFWSSKIELDPSTSKLQIKDFTTHNFNSDKWRTMINDMSNKPEFLISLNNLNSFLPKLNYEVLKIINQELLSEKYKLKLEDYIISNTGLGLIKKEDGKDETSIYERKANFKWIGNEFEDDLNFLMEGLNEMKKNNCFNRN